MAEAATANDLRNSPSDLSENELDTLLTAAKTKRETIALRLRFPPKHAKLASHMQVRKPQQIVDSSHNDGAYGSSCQILEKTVYLSIAPGRPKDEERTSKDLTLTSARWSIAHRYLTGGAGSETISVSLKYGDAGRKAFVSGYDDPGQDIDSFSEGGITGILRAVIGDLGGGSDLREVELLELLLGDFVKKHLDAKIDPRPSLRRVITDDLDDER